MRHAYGAVSVGAIAGLALGGANAAGMQAMRDRVRARDEAVVAGQWQRALDTARRQAHANAVRVEELENENGMLVDEIRRLHDMLRQRSEVIDILAQRNRQAEGR